MVAGRSRLAVSHAAEPVVAAVLLLAAGVEVVADRTSPLPPAVGLLGAFATTAPIAVSRRAPEVAALVVFAAVMLQALPPRMPSSIAEQLALAVALGQAAARVRRVRQLVVVAGVSAAAALVLREADDVAPSDYLFTSGLLAVPVAVGLVLRVRARTAAAARERARAADARRDEVAALAVQEERARMARELHDVVAHALSVVVVQAAGGRAVLAADPDAAEGAFSAIASAGERALVELRQMVGAMAASGAVPIQGLDGVADLVRRAGEAGSPVTLAVEGRPRPVLPSVELAAYRIVQESLTNAIRHAPGAATRVDVRYGAGLRIRVSTGAVDGDRPSLPGTGNGVLGMRERAALCGGRLTAAPTAAGGFLVEALLPIGGA